MKSKKFIPVIVIVAFILVDILIILAYRATKNRNSFEDYVVDIDPEAARAMDGYSDRTAGDLDIYPVYEYDYENKYNLNNSDEWARGAATSALTYYGCENVIDDFYDDLYYIVVFTKEGETYSIIVNDVSTMVSLLSGYYVAGQSKILEVLQAYESNLTEYNLTVEEVLNCDWKIDKDTGLATTYAYPEGTKSIITLEIDMNEGTMKFR